MRLGVLVDQLAGRLFSEASTLGLVEPAALLRATLLRLFLVVVAYFTYRLTVWAIYSLFPSLIEWCILSVPTITVKLDLLEASDAIPPIAAAKQQQQQQQSKDLSLADPMRPGKIQCWDPATGSHLGEVIAMSEKDVYAAVSKAKVTQLGWSKTTYRQRRMVLRTIQKYIVNNIETICRVCSRDSGKPKVDALLGEVMTTCEKIRCINSNGEEVSGGESRILGLLTV